MNNVPPRRRLAEVEIEELSTLLGPPPILSSENEAHYKRILKEFYACLGPADFFEVMLIRQFVDDLWVGQRYRRHQTLAVERRYRQNLEYQQKLIAVMKKPRSAVADEENENAPRELRPIIKLRDTITSSVADVDAILERGATEMEHNFELERGIVSCERFDHLISSADARGLHKFKLFEQYRQCLTMSSPENLEIIDAEVAEVAEPTGQPDAIEAPPLLSDVEEPSLSLSDSQVSGSDIHQSVSGSEASADEPFNPDAWELDPIELTRHPSDRTGQLRRKVTMQPQQI